MTEQTNTAPATPAAPQPSPVEQRAALMSDRTFTAAAAAGKGPQWDQLQSLDRQIAELNSISDDEPAAAGSQAHAKAIVDAHESGDDEDEAADQALAHINKVPDRPGLYELATDRARELGLPVDAEAEGELRQSFHAAGVSQSLAQTLYFAAVTAAAHPERCDSYDASAAALRKDWGAAFDTNIAAANAEARAIFSKLPASITKGVSYADWCRSSGIGNSRQVIQELFNRSRARRA